MPTSASMNASRREVLALLGGLGGLGALTLAGCGASGSDAAGRSRTARSSASAATTTPTTATTGATSTVTAAVPEETAGPFPGDGSNGPNVLAQNGVVRSDIRSSFGSSSAVAPGVPLTIALTVLDLANGAKPRSGAAVYVWHCSRDGQYSMYTQGVTGENYLRGVQATDANGTAKFTSIFPAAYSGRWPHIHFEVYPSVAAATSASGKLRTSQIALPQDACEAVYATDGYSASVRNLAQTSLASDMVFRDGWSQELATVTGNASSGYTANLVVGV